MRVVKMPKKLVNFCKRVTIGSWEVDLSTDNTDVDITRKEITICTAGFDPVPIETETWENYHTEIVQTIQLLNKMMTIDPEKGVQFNEDHESIPSKKNKFEFPNSDNIYLIR